MWWCVMMEMLLWHLDHHHQPTGWSFSFVSYYSCIAGSGSDVMVMSCIDNLLLLLLLLLLAAMYERWFIVIVSQSTLLLGYALLSLSCSWAEKSYYYYHLHVMWWWGDGMSNAMINLWVIANELSACMQELINDWKFVLDTCSCYAIVLLLLLLRWHYHEKYSCNSLLYCNLSVTLLLVVLDYLYYWYDCQVLVPQLPTLINMCIWIMCWCERLIDCNTLIAIAVLLHVPSSWWWC